MYLGDVVTTTPVLRALRGAYPDWDLHVLVPNEAVALLKGIRWLDRVWAFPRIRGRLSLKTSLPIIRELRRENFAVSIDFIGNDRGALLSRAVGAKRRVGVVSHRGFLLRSRCYTDRVEALDATRHASVRAWAVTAPLELPFPNDMTPEIAADPHYGAAAAQALGNAGILCYVTASQKKREWPPEYWLKLAALAKLNGTPIAFTGGSSARERQVLEAIAASGTDAVIIRPPEPLALLLATIAHAKLFVTGDTGPMHFAAALGVPTLSLFGPTAAQCWAPLGEKHHWIQGGLCPCSGHSPTCLADRPCLAQIQPEHAYEAMCRLAKKDPAPRRGASA